MAIFSVVGILIALIVLAIKYGWMAKLILSVRLCKKKKIERTVKDTIMGELSQQLRATDTMGEDKATPMLNESERPEAAIRMYPMIKS